MCSFLLQIERASFTPFVCLVVNQGPVKCRMHAIERHSLCLLVSSSRTVGLPPLTDLMKQLQLRGSDLAVTSRLKNTLHLTSVKENTAHHGNMEKFEEAADLMLMELGVVTHTFGDRFQADLPQYSRCDFGLLESYHGFCDD